MSELNHTGIPPRKIILLFFVKAPIAWIDNLTKTVSEKDDLIYTVTGK